MGVPNPWTALAARPHLQLHRLPIDSAGRYYDDLRSIVIRTGLTIEEERRHLWHELAHADRGDRAEHVNERVERLVDRHAAENAMPWCSLQWAWPGATDLEELAGLLKLPEAWVQFRLSCLHPAQRAILATMTRVVAMP